MGGPDVPCARRPRVLLGPLAADLADGLQHDGDAHGRTCVSTPASTATAATPVRHRDPRAAQPGLDAGGDPAQGSAPHGLSRDRGRRAGHVRGGLPAAPRDVGDVHGASRRSPAASARRAPTLSVAGRNLSMLWTAQDGWNTSRDGMIYIADRQPARVGPRDPRRRRPLERLPDDPAADRELHDDAPPHLLTEET